MLTTDRIGYLHGYESTKPIVKITDGLLLAPCDGEMWDLCDEAGVVLYCGVREDFVEAVREALGK